MNLVLACGIAFGAVFVLLLVLAGLMQALTRLLPPPAGADPSAAAATDPAIVAAITSPVATVMQGARVTHIEEES